MMIMMGHSSENNLLSCSYNAYATALNTFEQDRFPFCLAHTCLTGSYDNTTSLGGEDCFAEKITTYSQEKGFVGMLASSLKISWLNANQWGTGVLGKLPEAVWMNFSTIAGEFILEAKTNSNFKYDLVHKEILFNLNYFGDPALNLFPTRFLITEEIEIPDGSVISSPVYVQYPGVLKIPDNRTVYFENNGRIIVEEAATLKIGNNVTLWGSNPDNRIEVYGNLFDMTGRDTLTNVMFTALQTENNHQWGGLWVDNQDDLTFITCNLNHGSYVFDCDSLVISEGTDSNCVIHTTGKTNYTNITGAGFVNSQVLCDYPDEEASPEVHVSGNEFTNDMQMDFTIRFLQVPVFSVIQNTIHHKGLIGIDLQNIMRTASSDQLIENNIILNTGAPPDSSIGINLYNYRAKILNGNNITNHDYGVACIRSSNVSITGNPYASLNTAQSVSNNYKYQIKAFNSSFPLNLHFNKLTNSVSEYARIYHYNDGSVPTIPPEEGDRNVVCNYWGTGFDCEEDLYPANGYNCDGVWPPFPCQFSDGGEELFEASSNAADSGNFTLASNLMDSLIATWPNSVYAIAAVRDYYGIEESGSQNFSSLKQRYLTDSLFFQTENLQRTAEFMVKECDLRLGNYEEAMTWLESEVINPFNYADSICALIDLGFVNTLINNTGLKSRKELAPNGERLPLNLSQNDQWYRNLLLKLFNETDSVDDGNLPEDEISESGIKLISFGPNPLKDEILTIRLHSDYSDDVIINILSMDGKGIKSQKISINKGCETIEKINVGDIPSGIYIIRILSARTKEIIFRKLIIL